MPNYPNVKVKLVGEDGNAFFILARCRKAARKAGVVEDEIDTFHQEATSGDYNKLLATVMKWFSCDDEDKEVESNLRCPSCDSVLVDQLSCSECNKEWCCVCGEETEAGWCLECNREEENS